MTAQPLLQFGTVTLNPTPDRRVIRLQTAFGEQLFDIAERERVPKIPAHGTKNQLRRRLPPLKHCRSGCVLHDLFRLPVIPAKVATHPSLASLPVPFFASLASGSVVDWWVAFWRRWPWKFTLGLPRSSGGSVGPSSLRLKLLSEAQASISVPSTVKCSSLVSLSSRASATTVRKNSPATSCSSNRARLRLKLEWSKPGSSQFRSRNQRNKR